MKFPILVLSLTLFSIALSAQEISAGLELIRVLSPKEIANIQEKSQLACLAAPPLVLTVCEGDDSTDPGNMTPAGTVQIASTGGIGPIRYFLLHVATGQVFSVVSLGNPLYPIDQTIDLLLAGNDENTVPCPDPGEWQFIVVDTGDGTINGDGTDPSHYECSVMCTQTFEPTCQTGTPVFNVTDAQCGGTGSITLTVVQGNAYCVDVGQGQTAFQWSNGGTTPTISNLPPDTYTLTVTDFYGCTHIGSATVNETPGVEIFNCGVENPTLIGASDGSIFFQISNGTPPYTVSWAGGPTSGSQSGQAGPNTISGLPQGNYTVTITDDNGCEATCDVFLEDPLCMINVPCPSGPNADNTFTFNLNGGVAPFNIRWFGNNGNNGDEMSNGPTYTTPVLTTGTYNFVVEDANGAFCQVSCPGLEISVPDCSTLMITGTVVDSVDCNGGASGSIDLTLEGG
ncbi:MAG: SprB repeat-containing protein, partial [Bacteroidota bacterium]